MAYFTVAVALLLLAVTSSATRYAPYRYYPSQGANPYPGVPQCYGLPAYQIPVDDPQPAPDQADGQPPMRSYIVRLGPPDANGLRIPVEDTSLPENATFIDDANLQQFFTDLESGNTSVQRPDRLSEPFGCPPVDISFLDSLPLVPGSQPNQNTAFYLFCFTNCFPRFEWKVLPEGYFPRYVRLAYCPTRNCSIPLGQTCRLTSQRYISVLKHHCCQVSKVELVPNPTRPRPPPSTRTIGGKSFFNYPQPYYYPQPAYRRVVRTELKCGYYRIRIPTASTCTCACNTPFFRG